MKIGDEVFVHGFVDEIRNDCIIIRNNGGYFGTIKSEVVEGAGHEDFFTKAFTRGFELGLKKAQIRNKGRWELHEYDECYRCSKCGKRAPYDINEETGEKRDTIFDFCPFCGADMR